ncbi:lipase secretion chaperone [Paraburkholderia acidicola]|uniref:lipase secretion chaperone n=1 Tax=Paraburkholderia acidicola TaxID=1912599 RepID=UPI0012FFB074|nr:lipase secretion chaperone [Paraburkholderia acidicola]
MLATAAFYAAWPGEHAMPLAGNQERGKPIELAQSFSVAGAPAHVDASASRLSGTTPPDGLRADADGHLIKSRRVRDVFDYFLIEVGETSMKQVDDAVRAYIEKRLNDPARQEAIDLWTRYRHYREAEQKMTASLTDSSNQSSLDRMQLMLAQRTRLREQILPDVASSWYHDEEQADLDQMERMQIGADNSLTPQQRQARLAAIDSRDPTLMKAQAAGNQINTLSQLVSTMQKANSTPEEIGAAVAAQSDPETAQRLQQSLQQEADWSARYTSYQTEREAIIDSTSGNATERAAQIAQVRERYFPNPAEALRAQARDPQ